MYFFSQCDVWPIQFVISSFIWIIVFNRVENMQSVWYPTAADETQRNAKSNRRWDLARASCRRAESTRNNAQFPIRIRCTVARNLIELHWETCSRPGINWRTKRRVYNKWVESVPSISGSHWIASRNRRIYLVLSRRKIMWREDKAAIKFTGGLNSFWCGESSKTKSWNRFHNHPHSLHPHTRAICRETIKSILFFFQVDSSVSKLLEIELVNCANAQNLNSTVEF